MRTNVLDRGRKRVIAIAGTSLIHHINDTEQLRLINETKQQIGEDGILISGIVPNPINQAGQLIEAQAELRKPPDAYLLMPLAGISCPQGVYEQYMKFGERYGENQQRSVYLLFPPKARPCGCHPVAKRFTSFHRCESWDR